MSIAMIGAAAGLFAGIIQFVVLQRLVKAMKSKGGAGDVAPQAKVLNALSWVDLAMFPAIGWFIGALLQDGGFAP